jgi:hypothetical protein
MRRFPMSDQVDKLEMGMRATDRPDICLTNLGRENRLGSLGFRVIKLKSQILTRHEDQYKGTKQITNDRT